MVHTCKFAGEGAGHLQRSFKSSPLNSNHLCLCCRGWCELLCGRGCGFCVGPLKRYQEAFSAGRYIPTLQVSNYMNQEAIVQVMPPRESRFAT